MILDVNRVEKKYRVNPILMAELKARLSAYIKQDAHNQNQGYRVRSVYFDTVFDNDYQQKEDGIDNRKKIRLRVYDPGSDFAKLELKEKSGGMQRKQSLLLTKEEAEELLNSNFDCLRKRGEPLAKRLYTMMTVDIYRPKCMVEYDRFAFMSEDNDTRITFDCNLRASESDFRLFYSESHLYPVAAADDITMEVKYNNFLMSNVKRAISYRIGKELSNSKYCRARMVFKRTAF